MAGNGERRRLDDLPPWLPSIAVRDGQLGMTIRIPIPPLQQVEQLAYQADEHERACAIAQMTMQPPPPPATFDVVCALTEPNASAIIVGLTQLLEALQRAREVVDVKPGKPPKIIDVDGD